MKQKLIMLIEAAVGGRLEIARLLCGQKQAGKYAVWIAFFDGEEAVNKEWVDPDNRYGSREMAAKLANSGDLPKVKAFILADLVLIGLAAAILYSRLAGGPSGAS